MAEDSRSDKSETCTDFQLSLLRNLDSELRKNSDEVDFKKVKNVLELLNTMEVPKEKITIDQNKFEKDMKRKYGVKLKTVKPKEKLQYRVMRVACAVMIFVAVLFVVDRTTAKAFDFSLIEWVKSTAESFYFEFEGWKLEQDNDKEKVYSEEKDIESIEGVELKNIEQIPDKIGETYVIDGSVYELKVKAIIYNGVDNSIDIQYKNSKGDYVGANIVNANTQGNMAFSVADNRMISKDKHVGKFKVTLCQTKEKDVTAGIFIYNDMFYELDTNLGVEELENLIKQMKIIK